VTEDRKPTRAVERLRLTRRDLLKALQVTGFGAAAAGVGAVGSASVSTKTRSLSGTCRICTAYCGFVATVRDGRILKVEGDAKSPTRGFLCQHGHALPEIVHAEDRIRRPLKREGSRFREIPWSQAIPEIAERLLAVKKKHGGPAMALHTGWPFVRHPAIGYLQRFCYAFGSPNLSTVASLCEAALRMGKALTVGSGYFPDLPKARTLVLWGANPHHSMPPFAHQVASKSGEGRNLIVIDPVRTHHTKGSTLHLQILPGTDGALALGMLRLLLDERLVDARIAAEETVGLEELKALVSEWTLERTSQVTTVPAELIAKAARTMAGQGPTAIWDGLGVEHHENGIQTIRAIAAIQALLGGVDAPGGVALFEKAGPNFANEILPQLYRLRTALPVPPTPAKKPIGYDEYPLYEVFNRQAQANLYPRAILEDQPYPLRALLFFGCNASVTWAGSARLKQALSKLELLVSVDPFLTATGELSDYVLPAATFAESAATAFDPEFRSSIVKEQHEAWPDWKIVFELAKACGLGEYFPWPSFQKAIGAPKVPWMLDPAHQPTPTATGTPRYPTTTGKIELKSPLLERFGQEPLPRWVAPARQPTAEFPLWLVSGPRGRNHINSQFHNIHSIATNSPEPFVELHPDAAAAAKLADGRRVALVSPFGRIEMRLRVTDRVHPRAAVIPAGWAKANANLLTDGAALDPISGFPAMRSGVCRVEPAL
jgi:anaerobic selenocysteine-containing dehydrogenase